MRQPGPVYRLQSGDDLGDDVSSPGWPERPGLKLDCQRLAVHVFHDQERALRGIWRARLAVVEDAHKAFVRQRGSPAGSGTELTHRIGLATFSAQQFDRDWPGKINVGSVPNLAEPIGCDLAVEPVPSGDQSGADR